jgi:hypothetical protein
MDEIQAIHRSFTANFLHDESVACPLSDVELKVCELFRYMASCRAITPAYDPAFPCYISLYVLSSMEFSACDMKNISFDYFLYGKSFIWIDSHVSARCS